MRLVDAIRHRPWLAAVLGGALLGGVIGLFLPIRAADPPKADAVDWTLPTAQSLKRFREDQYQLVRGARYWGELAAAGGRRAAPLNWTPVAILTRPSVRVAVSVAGKKETQWVRLGEALPDGATLMSVTRDRIWFEKDGCRRERPLYPGKPDKATAAADACIGAPAATPTTPAMSRPPLPAPAGKTP